MNVAQYLIAVQLGPGDDSDGIEVVDLLKSLVLGDHERDDRTVTYRRFGVQEQITVSIDEFLKLIDDEIKNKALLNTENK